MRSLPQGWPQASFLLLSVVRRSELKGKAGRGIIPGRETERGRCTEEDAPEWPIWAVAHGMAEPREKESPAAWRNKSARRQREVEDDPDARARRVNDTAWCD